MKVLLYSRYGEYPKSLEPLVKSFGLEVVAKNPDLLNLDDGEEIIIRKAPQSTRILMPAGQPNGDPSSS